MNRRLVALILLGVLIVAGLLTCGYFGLKIARHVRLRRAVMTVYENKEYALAEPLLFQYVQKNQGDEAGFVALANIYHDFGNAEMEAQMWQTAATLNPQNPEYREKMLNSMVKAANYALMHGVLGRKARADEQFTDRELYLYVISSYRSGYPKDGENAYNKCVKRDPEAFHRNELGRMAEFIAVYETLSDSERDTFLIGAMQSDDPGIRFEAVYTDLRRLEQRDGDDPGNDEEFERLLKQATEANYFAGTALLADFYFSRFRFAEVIEVLGPYLKTIDDINLYLLYAESCAFTGNLKEIGNLEKKLRQKPGFLPFMADYCEILIAYLENDEDKLASVFRKNGKRVDSPLSRFIRLRVAMANGSFNEILSVTQDIFSNPPFHDLHDRALIICMDYVSNEMKKTENRKDPSQMAVLAKVLSGYLHENRLLTEIIFMDQYKRGMLTEIDLMAALEHFPDDLQFQLITAEYLVFHEKAEQALPIIEQVLDSEQTADQPSDHGIQLLLMLALDQLGRHDEATAVFRKLLEQSEFDMAFLAPYFQFCVSNKRIADLESLADRPDEAKDGQKKHFSGFFRAAALLLTEDESKRNEALDLLASTPTDAPDFTFYAANNLYRYGRLDEAEAKYRAILKTYRTPSLPYVNLSDIYLAKGDKQKALEVAETAFDLEKESMLPAFVYAKRLSEAERFEEAVTVLNFPRHAVNYRKDIVYLWCECMHHVIEKSIANRKLLQAEEQCKHLLIVAPDDGFGKDHLEKVRKMLLPKHGEE